MEFLIDAREFLLLIVEGILEYLFLFGHPCLQILQISEASLHVPNLLLVALVFGFKALAVRLEVLQFAQMKHDLLV